jgi:hypothetical protein
MKPKINPPSGACHSLGTPPQLPTPFSNALNALPNALLDARNATAVAPQRNPRGK